MGPIKPNHFISILNPYFPFGKRIFSNLVFSCTYAFIYILAYKYFLFTYFEYFGYLIVPRNWWIWVISIGLSIAPYLLFKGYKAISSFIAFFIYLLLYVPTVLTFAFASSEQDAKIILVQMVFATAMSMIFFADRIVFKNVNIEFKQKLPIHFFLYATLITTLFILWSYRENLKLVTFTEVYKQRLSNESVGSNVIVRYIVSWLSYFFIPICLAYGIALKKYLYLIVGILASISIYMAVAAKGIILMPVILLIIFLFLNKNGIERIFQFLGYMGSVLILTLVTLAKTSSIIFLFSSLFLMRTLSIGGLLNLKYYEFFTNHPNTYFSHVNIINGLTGIYPYGKKDLGQVIGSFYWSDRMNANANFWATDGIASTGIFGILLISLIFCGYLIILNFLTRYLNKSFVVLLAIPLTFSLLNISFFSTLISGGGFFILISLLFLDKNKMADIPNS